MVPSLEHCNLWHAPRGGPIAWNPVLASNGDMGLFTAETRPRFRRRQQLNQGVPDQDAYVVGNPAY